MIAIVEDALEGHVQRISAVQREDEAFGFTAAEQLVQAMAGVIEDGLGREGHPVTGPASGSPAGAAGIPCVTLHPPLDDAHTPQDLAEQFALNCRFYERAVERARAAGTKLATHSPWPPAKGLWGAKEYDSLFDAVPAPENGMIFCFGCMAMTGYDVRDVLARFVDRTFMVHVRDVVIHADGQVDEVFPGTGQVRPDTAIALLHQLGYRGAIAPEHLPRVFGERKNEISMAWAAGYCHAALASLV